MTAEYGTHILLPTEQTEMLQLLLTWYTAVPPPSQQPATRIVPVCHHLSCAWGTDLEGERRQRSSTWPRFSRTSTKPLLLRPPGCAPARLRLSLPVQASPSPAEQHTTQRWYFSFPSACTSRGVTNSLGI